MTQGVVFVLVSPFGFFLIAFRFLVAGLLTPASLARKGTARHLGGPLARRADGRTGPGATARGPTP